ncbi:hypothetical protein [Streptomyces rhizosphaericus]|uniref:Uncharacterized protein n=1 Tax=Streptomyces rhizosphaericus TaxID=114699 RepID=A0A6G4AYY3_9ACTN|nr:hypothetical protein [Streptomyces rhizosphaericus]NEW77751.1 hypothetical protein [Streptomyces rhizosphaericus]
MRLDQCRSTTGGLPPDCPVAVPRRPRPRQYFVGTMRVPYIAPWTGENVPPRTAITTRYGRSDMGIGYADEYGIADRRRGALWIRVSVNPGAGGPLLDRVHALRQRQAMTHMLCQYCGRPADDRSDGRYVFLLPAVTGRLITDGERTATPPVCGGCVPEVVRGRAPLRRGCVAVLVEDVTVWGVAGMVYAPETLKPVPSEDGGERFTLVAYDDPRLPWTLACREVVSLHGCTAMDLEDLTEQTAA